MSNTTCRRAVPPRGLKSRRISPSPPPPQTPAAFCAAWRFGEGAMGVGLYSVSCGYGYGCGFGGLTSLIAMVLALRAREALRMVMGGKVFSGPSLSWLARRCARSVGIRSHGFALRAKPRVGSCAPNAASPFGRPVQHLRRPSRSSAHIQGGETPPSELRALPAPFTFTPPSVRG